MIGFGINLKTLQPVCMNIPTYRLRYTDDRRWARHGTISTYPLLGWVFTTIVSEKFEKTPNKQISYKIIHFRETDVKAMRTIRHLVSTWVPGRRQISQTFLFQPDIVP